MGVCTRIDLRGRVRPGQILNTSCCIHNGQGRGSVRDTTVPSERCVLNVKTDVTRGVHWVDPNIRTVLHVKSSTGGTTGHVSVDGHDVRVGGEHTVVCSADVSITDHRQVTVFFVHTGCKARNRGSVQGECNVGVVSNNSDGGRQIVTGHRGADIVEVTIGDHNSVVAEVDHVL